MPPAGTGRRGYPPEDRLPWLEDVPAEAPPRSWSRLVFATAALVIIALAAWGAVRWWEAPGDGDDGAPLLIRAPAGPYKVRPAEPGGMDVEGEGSAAYVASEGGDPRGAIDLAAVPEAPVARRTVSASAPDEQAGEPRTPETGGAIQLGAFSTEAKANAAWKALSQRFRFLAPLTPVILPAKSGEATVYRLRAPAGVNARAMCGRLTVAGETCLIVR